MTTRRLAAIIAADVAGYSRLMHADEEGTHAAFIAIMTGAVEPAIAQHVGRIVKNTGDGFISEFPSAVEAVRCAVQFQDTITRGSAGNPTAPQLRLRVGINLSDVIIEPHDIFGDGVNIAARLEGLAEPGGILISAAVHEQVRGRIPCRFEDLGEQQVRNIAAPVRVYRVLPAAESAQAPALQDGRARLSIAVLPFLNLSQDGDLDYVVDGIVDNLITDLSRALPGSFVISRSTAFTYKGRHVPIRQIGEELGVRYILEGSVRADAARLRVDARLIDARTEEHLWAERFDKERRDILQVQDEIVARLSRSIGVEMVRNEGRRCRSQGGKREDAVDLVMRGNAVATDLSRKERAAEAVALFTRALELDPDNVDAMVGIASTRIYQIVNHYQTEGREALLDEAQALIERAMGLAADHIGVLRAHAVLLGGTP